MRIGVLTGGGDCPGLNAVIRAIVRKGAGVYGHEFVGYRDGWRGPAGAREPAARGARGAGHPAARGDDPRVVAHQPAEGRRRLGQGRREPRGGRSRGPDRDRGRGHPRRRHAARLGGASCVGVPKTIDNDLGATDYTFGFDTAVNIAMEAIDRLHTTAESHHRVLIVEVMGRHAGWIALPRRQSPEGANVILIPEVEFSIEPRLRVHRTARSSSSTRRSSWSPKVPFPRAACRQPTDRPTDAFGHVRLGGIAHWLEGEIERRTGPRGARDGPGPRPAGRHADRLRPRARDPLRPGGDRRRRRGGVGQDDGAARDRDRAGGPVRGDRRAEDGSRDFYRGAEVFFG